MSKNTTTTAVATNQFEQDKATALAFIEKMGWKSERIATAKAMVDPALTDDERDDILFTYDAGYVRRAFRQIALFIEKQSPAKVGVANEDEKQDLADVFWALRDDIEPYAGTWFRMGEDVA